MKFTAFPLNYQSLNELFYLLCRVLAEDSLQACSVVLWSTVVEVDTVLLLLNIGELGVAVAPNLVANREQCINLLLQTLIELLHCECRFAITPR